MSLSGIIIFIGIALVLYYVGMFFWDNIKDSFTEQDKHVVIEEEIDISSDIQPNETKPVLVEVEPSDQKNKENKKNIPRFPFPWTSEQIKTAFEKIDLGEECQELENVIFFNSNHYKQTI